MRSTAHQHFIIDGAGTYGAPSLTGNYWWLVTDGGERLILFSSVYTDNTQAHTGSPNENQWVFSHKNMKVVGEDHLGRSGSSRVGGV